jgi:hypothetical protein
MRHYAGLVDRGEFNETLVSTVPALPSYVLDSLNYVGIDASCVIDGNTYDLTRIQPNHIETSVIDDSYNCILTLDGGNLTLPSECINEIDSSYVDSVANFSFNILTARVNKKL